MENISKPGNFKWSEKVFFVGGILFLRLLPIDVKYSLNSSAMLSGFVRVLCLTSKEQGFFLLPFFLEYVILSDHIRTQTHNHLLHKQTLNQTQTHNDLVDK